MKLFDGPKEYPTEKGQELVKMVWAAIEPIVEHCAKNEFELRTATHVATETVTSAFLLALLKKQAGAGKENVK